jgi:putative protease
MRSMELLAPAGSWESMVAAVRAGADAIYLGADGFNARRYATGFSANPTDEHSLHAAVGYCHIRGVKVHVALNILISEKTGLTQINFHGYIAPATAMMLRQAEPLNSLALFFDVLDRLGRLWCKKP